MSSSLSSVTVEMFLEATLSSTLFVVLSILSLSAPNVSISVFTDDNISENISS